MTLAEALVERKGLAVAIAALQQRALAALVHVDGEPPDDKVPDLLAALDGAVRQYERLIGNINKTNNLVKDPETGMTMTEMLAKRDAQTPRAEFYAGAARRARQRNDGRQRYGVEDKSAPKLVTQVASKALQVIADEIAVGLRNLNNRIQALNHSAELAE